jgi:hypothetical protein
MDVKTRRSRTAETSNGGELAPAYRPVGLRVANHAGRALLRLRPRTLTLDADALTELARRRTGLDVDTDLGEGPHYAEGLEILLSALQAEARLSPAGRYFAREQVVTSLSNRLALRSTLDRDPLLRAEPLDPAIVIVGLPRSGTTLLQHLLARDPDHRVLRHWEASRPAAARGPDEDRAARRATDRTLRFLDYLCPDARALHPVDTDEPTECVTLFSNSFASLELATNNQLPSYLSWCLGSDLGFAYREYALQLRVLQAHERRPRWLLKSPAHLFWMDRLSDVLPDARVVQIHRDPAEVLGSFCTLSAVLSGISSDHVDLRALGTRWAAAWEDGLSRLHAARRMWPDDRWVDVGYSELVGSPLAAVEHIYASLGIDLTETARSAMSRFLTSQQRRTPAARGYDLSTFGLVPADVTERFALLA